MRDFYFQGNLKGNNQVSKIFNAFQIPLCITIRSDGVNAQSN
jgi:hypothetical protein